MLLKGDRQNEGPNTQSISRLAPCFTALALLKPPGNSQTWVPSIILTLEKVMVQTGENQWIQVKQHAWRDVDLGGGQRGILGM